MIVPLVNDVVVVVVVVVVMVVFSLGRFRLIVEEERFRVAAAASAASRTRRDGVTLRRTRPVMWRLRSFIPHGVLAYEIVAL